jgi:hypothetical protein
LILDAGPVIGLHELGVWNEFLARYQVVLPQSVLDDEALFHSADAASGMRQPIDLVGHVASGDLTVASADSGDLLAVASRFSAAIELHAGELEALALLTLHGEFADHVFCSADGAAIEAACMVGLSDRCDSLEELLALAGLGRPVKWRFSKDFVERHKREGGSRAVTGYGLAE